MAVGNLVPGPICVRARQCVCVCLLTQAATTLLHTPCSLLDVCELTTLWYKTGCGTQQDAVLVALPADSLQSLREGLLPGLMAQGAAVTLECAGLNGSDSVTCLHLPACLAAHLAQVG